MFPLIFDAKIPRDYEQYDSQTASPLISFLFLSFLILCNCY